MDFFHSLPLPEFWEWDFFIPFPFPKFGNGFFYSLPVPEFREWAFSVPFPFPNIGNGLFQFPSRSRTLKSHSRSPLLLTPEQSENQFKLIMKVNQQRDKIDQKRLGWDADHSTFAASETYLGWEGYLRRYQRWGEILCENLNSDCRHKSLKCSF